MKLGENRARINRVGQKSQNHGKQVLRISCIKFHLLTIQFVVISHGKRDLSSLPEAVDAALQIPSKKEAVGQLMRSCQANSIFPVIFSKPVQAQLFCISRIFRVPNRRAGFDAVPARDRLLPVPRLHGAIKGKESNRKTH